jgi:hypothetical protein
MSECCTLEAGQHPLRAGTLHTSEVRWHVTVLDSRQALPQWQRRNRQT